MTQVSELDEQCIKERLYGELLIKYENGKRICIKKSISIKPEGSNGKEKERLQVNK